MTADDKDIMARGYKLRLRKGEKWFCRREAPVGTNIEHEECNTAESILAKRRSSVETVRQMQANKPEISN